MINAYEAKRKTLINCKCKDVMNMIEKVSKKQSKLVFIIQAYRWMNQIKKLSMLYVKNL